MVSNQKIMEIRPMKTFLAISVSAIAVCAIAITAMVYSQMPTRETEMQKLRRDLESSTAALQKAFPQSNQTATVKAPQTQIPTITVWDKQTGSFREVTSQASGTWR